ncbi:MAG: ABC transporter substrate-binding protein [Armatimonadetes bacterium]|nr:ABC transporter substrate-binding protein [Armatimonadota bacterium]MDW8153549.1 ABC transporter substrate-binding protein [Armatimonadota bacterium]
MRVYNPYTGWVTFPDPPARIVSLNPSVTEILFALDLGGRVVGVSSWCHRPPQARSKPKVGSYVRVLRDRLAELQPDLVLTTTGTQRAVIEELCASGFPTYPIPFPRDVYAILSTVVEVGGLVGAPQQALELAARLLDQLQRLPALRREAPPPRVYVEIDLGGPTVPGYANHITGALHLAGIHNVFGHVPVSYLYGMPVEGYEPMEVAAEIRTADPDVIVYECKHFQPRGDEGLRLMHERGLADLRAVRRGRVLTLPADTLAHYGPAFVHMVTDVCRSIWEVWGKPPP